MLRCWRSWSSLPVKSPESPVIPCVKVSMEIPHLSRNLRNFSNPYLYSFAFQSPFPSNILYHFGPFYTTMPSTQSAQSIFNSVGSSLFCNTTSQSLPSLCLFERGNGGSLDFNLALFRSHYRSCRSFSSSSFSRPSPEESQSKRNAASKQFWDIIDIIRGNHKDLESKLDSLNLRLTTYLVAEIFRVLNYNKVSAFRFFKWVRAVKSTRFPCNSDVYSLLIDNFGRLDDYEGMFHVLGDFRRTGIDLNHNAFRFLLVQLSNEEESIKTSVRRVVELLNKVGGSCRTSGVMALIEMFSSLGSFTMAKFVIEITDKKSSFYNIIIREQCRGKDFEGAMCTLNEKRAVVGCGLDVGILNYLLSSMCKNEKFDDARRMFQEMLEERYCPPSSLTFEVMICHLCVIGNIESALCFLDMMVSRGVEPRLSTHAAFVKYYFNLQRYEEAYSYAVDSSLKHCRAKSATYSLLASLHEKSGNLVVANKILSELMDGGLKPNFPVYIRVMKKLHLEGREDLANDLKGKFSKFSL